jgi:enoyl-[acyl-carrier-protein] reductase (NADH)
MKRFAEPEEIAELVLFMCSDACQFMTADTVYVNGGGGWRLIRLSQSRCRSRPGPGRRSN